jgi:hypothetical protein
MKRTKNTINEQMEQGMGMAMPANGVAFTPDGRGNMTPMPIVTANNYAKAQVPTTMAAMAGGMGGPMGGAPMSAPAPTQNEPEEPVEEEEEEEEEEGPVETSEATTKFTNALIELLGEEVADSTLVTQLEAIFEAAVQEKVNSEISKTIVSLDEGVKNYLENVTGNLVEKVDDYLDYVVEEWMQENAVAVEQGIKTQIAENFITGLKNLFENHYIDVPAEKYNALDELYSHNVELTNTLNKALNENINLRKEMSLTECAGIFVAETKDLADTQVAKLQSLMENVAFTTPEEYREKLVTIKENYLNSSQSVVRAARSVPQQINEEMTFSPVAKPENNTVESYVNVIGKLNKKL